MAGQEELFALALGIEEPIYIETVEFDKGNGELHIRMNFRCGTMFTIAFPFFIASSLQSSR